MSLLEKAETADTVERSPLFWSEDNGWRDEYLPVNKDNKEGLEQLGAARRRQQALEREDGEKRAPMIP